MLDFVKSAFRKLLGAILWINLILWAILGGIAGKLLSDWRSSDKTFLGVIIGLAVGLLLDIVCGGYIATILNIDKNLEEIRNNTNHSSSGEALISDKSESADKP
jgi:hypothetical protein